jgi:hypothetical protein
MVKRNRHGLQIIFQSVGVDLLAGMPEAAVPSKPLRSFTGINLTSGVTRSTVTVQDSFKPPGTSKIDGCAFGRNGRTRGFRFTVSA